MTKRKNSHNEMKLNIKLNIRLNISQKHYMGHGWWNSLSHKVRGVWKLKEWFLKSQVALLVIELRFSKNLNFIVWSLRCQNMSKSNDLLIIKKFQCKLK